MSSKAFRERSIIVLDFETTGLDPELHEIIEVGAIKVTHDLQEIDRFEKKLAPKHIHTAQPEALAVNGYTEALWAQGGRIGPILGAKMFQEFSRDCILCAWPIGFESEFLDAWFENTFTKNLMEYRERDYYCIDIPSIAWAVLPDLEKPSMSTVSAYFGVAQEAKPHRAIAGAEKELEILRLLKGKL